MKTIKLILVIILPLNLLAQTQNENLQRYWRLRERLKNFVVPGEAPGGSLISFVREKYYKDDGTILSNGYLNYGDETIRLADYIAMLALEYKMIKDHGLPSTLLDKTTQELAFAIRAFNRLDITAEDYWNTYYSGTPCSYTSAEKEDLRTHHLNGFFIREDVPHDFTNTTVNDHLVENYLNSSYFPVDDGRIVDVDKYNSFSCIDVHVPGAYFTVVPCDAFNGRYSGPIEESLDQAVEMMMALAIVVKCVPSGTEGFHDDGSVIDYFDGGVTGIAEEAQKIAHRMTQYMVAFNWKIENPVTCSCVKGVAWGKDVSDGDPCKCQYGGADMEVLAYGMAWADCRIQTAALGSSMGSDSDTKDYYCTHYFCEGDCIPSCSPRSDFILSGGKTFWMNHIKDNTIADDYKPSALAAISNVWGDETDNSLYYRCQEDYGKKYHLPLVNKFLYGGAFGDDFFNESTYQSLLNGAACYAAHADDPFQYSVWSNPSGLLYGGMRTDPASAETDNLSYLFYFNIFNLFKPSYLSEGGVTYHYIDPSQLCESDINKTGFVYNINQANSVFVPFVESDQKGFHASNSINVSNGIDLGGNPIAYVIANDDDSQPWPLSQANITYEAGNEINLHAGFEVHEGAEFHATINTNLHPMDCSGVKSPVIPYNTKPQMNHLSEGEVQNIFNGLVEESAAKDRSKLDPSVVAGLNLEIAPNPNNGSFQVNVSKDRKPVSIKEMKVYDIMGKVIWETRASSNSSFSVDISDYASGIYYVKCVTESGELLTKKLIKQ
ncbi:MAG: T9SS type A sorting domain-containing protein [Bacteroidia bacterium]